MSFFKNWYKPAPKTIRNDKRRLLVETLEDRLAPASLVFGSPTISITEGGTSVTYTVGLDATPTFPVAVAVNVGDAQLGVSPTSLSFNSTATQTITVTISDDSIAQGTRSSTITHTTASTDPLFHLLTGSVAANITDNDTAGVAITETLSSTAVTEAGGTDTYSIVLTSKPTSTVTVNIAVDSQVSVSATSILFTTANWNTPQAITASAAIDFVAEGSHTGVIQHTATSTDPNYVLANTQIAKITATITDNDTVGVTIGAISGGVTEVGATATYVVNLSSQPSSAVTVSMAIPNAQVTVSPAILTFTSANFATGQTVTVTAVNDFLQEGAHTSVITHSSSSSDTQYNNLSGIANITAAITDNDTAGATITAAGGVKEAGATSTTYTIVLNTIPADYVYLTLVNNDGQISISPTTLTFSPSDWYLPQVVTVTAVDDLIDEGPAATHNGLINYISSSPGDPNYHNNAAITGTTTTVAVTENDVAGVTVSKTAVGITEGGNSDTYTIVLNTKPVNAVTITINPAATDLALPTAGNITFDATNWNIPRVITVTASVDQLYESTETRTITHNVVAGSDARYIGAVIATVSADITDANSPGVIITEAGGTVVTEGSTTDTFTVVLNSQVQTSNVLVTMNAGSQMTLTPLTTLTFTNANWSVPQTVTVTPNNDLIVEGTHSGIIQYTTSAVPADNPGYNGIATTPTTVTILDSAATPIGLVLNKTTTTVVEDGATDTFTVVLNLRPTDDVNVAINPGQPQLTTSPTSLIFTSGNWNVPQTITISASDDSIAQVTHTGSVNIAATSLDSNYSGKGQTVAVTIGDPNNRAPVNSVPNNAQSIAEDNGAPLTFNVANDNLISVADVDAGTSVIQVTVSVANGLINLAGPFPAGITFVSGDGINDLSTTFTGNLTDVNFVLNAMTYQPKPNFFGTDTLTIITNDQGNSGPGGAKSDTDTVSISVISVADGPVITVPAAQTTNEDTAKIFSTANGNLISFTDSDFATGNVTATLSVTNGVLSLNNTGSLSFATGDGVLDGSMTFTGTVARINAVLAGLKYTPNADFNGSDTLVISIDDGTIVGAASVDITVTAVNDRPTITLASTVQTVYVGSGAHTVAGFVTDFIPGPDDEISQTVVAYTTPKVSNTALFSVQPFVDAAGNLTFTVANGVSGTTTVDLVVQDSGGGTDKSYAKVFTITVSKTIKYIDEDDDIYSVTLNGPGNVDVIVDDVDGDGTGAIQTISLKDTTQASSLVVAVTKAGSGDGFVNIGTIQNPDDTGGNGIGIITAPTANLIDGGINLSGLVGAITVNNITNGADINTGGANTAKTVVVAKGSIGDGSDLTVSSTLSLTAASFAVGTITAPAMGTMTINGNFSASNITLAGINALTPTLGAVTIAGNMPSGTLWDITGRTGKITLKGNVTDWTLNVKNTGGANGQNGTITDGDGKLDGLAITGDVSKAIINVAETIGAVSAKSWTEGSITAESMASLTTSTGNFLVPLTLTSDSTTVPALGTTTIAGSVTGTSTTPVVWSIDGGFTNNITVKGAASFWNLLVDNNTIPGQGGNGKIGKVILGAVSDSNVRTDGSINSLAATSWSAGSIIAGSITTSLTTSGNFTGALALVGTGNVLPKAIIGGDITGTAAAHIGWSIPAGYVGNVTVKGSSSFFDISATSLISTAAINLLEVNGTPAIGATTLNLTGASVSGTTILPVGTTFTLPDETAGANDPIHIVTGHSEVAGVTTSITFTPALIGGLTTGNDIILAGAATSQGFQTAEDPGATAGSFNIDTNAAFLIPIGTPFKVAGSSLIHTVTARTIAGPATTNITFVPALAAGNTVGDNASITLLFGKATNIVLGTVTNSTITADQNIALVQAAGWTRTEIPASFLVNNATGYAIGTATMTVDNTTASIISNGATFVHGGTTHTVTSSTVTGTSTTSITFTPALTAAYVDNDPVNSTASVGTDIVAGSIKSLNITGTSAFGSLVSGAGEFKVVLNGAGLTAGTGAASNILNSAFVGGTVTNTKFDLTGAAAGNATAGNVGTFTAGGFDTSKLFVGVTGFDLIDPTTIATGNIADGRTIATFTIKGNYTNSLVAADILGKVTVNTLVLTAGGANYGFAADTRINSFKSTTPSKALTTVTADVTDTNFIINIV